MVKLYTAGWYKPGFRPLFTIILTESSLNYYRDKYVILYYFQIAQKQLKTFFGFIGTIKVIVVYSPVPNGETVYS